MITILDYLWGWKAKHPSVVVDETKLNDVLRTNAGIMVDSANQLLVRFGEWRKLTSGWRPVEVNAVIPGAAKFSNHTRCQAIDLEDHDGLLDQWCLDNQHVLVDLMLWQEHPSATKGWCHLQTIPPRSGNRVFYP